MEKENMRRKMTKNKICKYIKEEMFKKDADFMADISEATLYRWIDEDESSEIIIEASMLEFKHTLMKNVNTSGVKDGRLALEILKRCFLDDWSGPSVDSAKQTYESSTQRVADLLQAIYAAADKQDTEQGRST